MLLPQEATLEAESLASRQTLSRSRGAFGTGDEGWPTGLAAVGLRQASPGAEMSRDCEELWSLRVRDHLEVPFIFPAVVQQL